MSRDRSSLRPSHESLSQEIHQVEVDADEAIKAKRSSLWLHHWRLLEQCQAGLMVVVKERDLGRTEVLLILTEELLAILQLLDAERRHDRMAVAALEVRCRDLSRRRRSLEAACSS